MYELVELVQSHPTCIESENEKHAFDEVGLPRTIGAYHTREIAVELANHLSPCVGLEVFQHHMVDHQSRLLLTRHVQIHSTWNALYWHNLDGLFLGSKSVETGHALAATVLLLHE